MRVTGFWSLLGAGITGLIAADVLYRWYGANRLLSTGSRATFNESRLLAGRS